MSEITHLRAPSSLPAFHPRPPVDACQVGVVTRAAAHLVDVGEHPLGQPPRESQPREVTDSQEDGGAECLEGGGHPCHGVCVDDVPVFESESETERDD